MRATLVHRIDRHRGPIVLALLLIVAQLNALQWQTVWFLRDILRLDGFIGADRTIEVLGWSIVAVAVLRSRREEPDRPLGLPLPAALLLLATVTLITLHGAVRLVADGPMLPPLRPLLLLVVLAVAARLGSRVVAAATVLALAPGIVGTLLVALTGWELAFRGMTRARLLGPDLFEASRLQGLYPHPNNAGAFAVLLAVIAMALLVGTRRGIVRISLFALIVTATLVLAASDSITAAAALFAALAGRLLAPALRGLTAKAMVVAALAGGAALTALPFVLAHRLSPGALTGRVHVWQEVLAALTARERRWGIGPEPLLRSSDFRDGLTLLWDAGDAHNTPFELLLVAGIPGLVAFGSLATAMLWVALRTLEVSRGWSLPVAIVPLVLGVGEVLFVHGPADGRDVFLVTVGILLAWTRESGPPPPTLTDGAQPVSGGQRPEHDR